MTPLELILRSVVYAVGGVSVLAAAVWYGWELRERLAVKLEYFRLTNRQWADYDAQLKAHAGKVPMRAELHDINEHRGERQSDR